MRPLPPPFAPYRSNDQQNSVWLQPTIEQSVAYSSLGEVSRVEEVAIMHTDGQFRKILIRQDALQTRPGRSFSGFWLSWLRGPASHKAAAKWVMLVLAAMVFTASTGRPSIAEGGPNVRKIGWLVDGESKVIQANQYAEFYDLLSKLYDNGARPASKELANPDGGSIIELLAANDLLVGEEYRASIGHFLCQLNNTSCRLVGSRSRNLLAPRWTNGKGDAIRVPDVQIVRLPAPKPFYGARRDIPKVVVDSRRGCKQYDAQCKEYISRLNGGFTDSDSTSGALVLPTEVSALSIDIDLTGANTIAKSLADLYVSKVAPAQTAWTASSASTNTANVDLVDALNDVKSAISWQDLTFDSQSVPPSLGLEIVDSGFDANQCALKLHKIFALVQNPDNTTPVTYNQSASPCGQLYGADNFDNAERVHGTHILGIVGGLLTASDPAAPSQITYRALEINKTGLGDPVYNATVRAKILEGIRGKSEVINLSLGYTPNKKEDDPLQDLIRRTSKAALYVVSAGNYGHEYDQGETCHSLPACGTYSENMITVVATTSTSSPGNVAFTSNTNYGQLFDIGAPGAGVRSTVPMGYIVAFSGSSQAAAVVSAAALRLKWRLPELPPSRIRDRLIYTSDITEEFAHHLFGGQLNVTRALDVTRDVLTIKEGSSINTYRGRFLLTDEPGRKRPRNFNPDLLPYIDARTGTINEDVTRRSVRRLEWIDAEKLWILYFRGVSQLSGKPQLQKRFIRLDGDVEIADGLFVTEDGHKTIRIHWPDVLSFTACIRDGEDDRCAQE
jgi:hypothetical protein